MENLTGKVLELGNDEKYLVVRQASYKGKTYLYCGLLNEDESDTTDKFLFFEKKENELEEVKDEEILRVLVSNIKITE